MLTALDDRPQDEDARGPADRPPRISLAVMHHPARAAALPRLAAACAPLPVTPVADPCPLGPPSPLRTAKLAWAAVPPGATHHVVLQDDVTPVPGFAAQLTAVLTARPRDAVALYVNWNSPYNAYLARRAAVAGSPWAPLAPREWVPTLGLALPAAAARGLAAYLAEFPDELKDDDELIVRYCAEAGLTVLAAVPHLLEHQAGPSLAGNGEHGARHAAVPTDAPLPAGHWSGPVPGGGEPPRTTGGLHYAVELVRSRCLIRLMRDQEPAGHPFAWSWADWAPLLGADPAALIRDFERTAGPAGLPVGTLREVWAAGWLLGRDAAPPAGRPVDRAAALRTWVLSGLAERDARRLTPAVVEAVTGLALRALAAGARAAACHAPDEVHELPGPAGALARREAEALTFPAPEQSPPVAVRCLPCPYCPSGPAELGRALAPLPYERLRVLPDRSAPLPEELELTLLACELPDARAMLAVTAGARRAGPDRRFSSRAAALVVRSVRPVDQLAVLDRAERWWDGRAGEPDGPYVLPMSLRVAARCNRPRLPGLGSGGPATALDTYYRAVRYAAVARAL
ncbi:hypothetical protein ACIRPK_11580 [Kitasatospora sp. NPDC101801]|uniref:hypothetical protein n=1 Tax=Kitasatospora sp. NPDC101801 TaxID=3364103 RepID=UPI00381633BA